LPVMIGVYTLPESILKPFDEEDLRQPLVNFVAQFSRQQLEYGHVQFEAAAASLALAVDFSVEPGTPLLDMNGAVYCSDDRPLFLMREYYRQGEGLRFRIVQP
jgi:DNA-binding GntR family transcriptional regulator